MAYAALPSQGDILQHIRSEKQDDNVNDTCELVYKPLESERHIRLLRIRNFHRLRTKDTLPSTTARRLSPRFLPYYDIVQVDLNHPPQYSAISYAWGEPKRSHIITISGTYHLKITESLAAALDHLPGACLTGLLWIDQICIDQSNVQERNHQVRIMGDIYRNAMEVIIWAGEEIEGLDRVACLAGRKEKYSNDNLEALSRLLHRPWFMRSWVVQEAALAKTASVLTGSCQITFLDLFQAWNKDGNHWTEKQMSGIFNSSITLRAIMALRADCERPRLWEPGWDALLNHLGDTQTSDPRDHIYAFLGIKNDLRISIIPNYALSTSEVFAVATKAIIDGTNTLNVFRFLPKPRANSKEQLLLPSWVPDWSRRNYNGRIFEDPWYCGDVRFKAARGLRHHPPPNGYSQQLQLNVSGQITDCILSLLPTYEPLHQIEKRLLFFGLSNDQVLAIDQTAHFDQAQSLRQRLVTVLVAGQVRENETGPNETKVLSTAEQTLRLYEYTENLTSFSGFHTRRTRLSHYRLIYTQGGKLGLAPNLTMKGDVMAILHGLDVPVVLRRTMNGTYILIGQCYLENSMFGEAVTWKECEAQSFILI